MTNGGYLLGARLNVILPRIPSEIAQKLVDAAHQECPYSKATRGNINVQINLKTEPVAQAETSGSIADVLQSYCCHRRFASCREACHTKSDWLSTPVISTC